MQTIVIVEDERVLREELSVLLQNAGYQVKCITEFQEVAKQLKEAKADLILLDINLFSSLVSFKLRLLNT
jgi:DNA-binding response OmpR family regulator